MIRILLVDDDANFTRVIRHQLARMGCVVEEIPECALAVDCCRLQAYDAVIIDINNPAMRGLAAVRELRALCPQTPVIVMSAFSTAENIGAVLKAGAADFLEKPCEEAILHETVRQRLASGAPDKGDVRT